MKIITFNSTDEVTNKLEAICRKKRVTRPSLLNSLISREYDEVYKDYLELIGQTTPVENKPVKKWKQNQTKLFTHRMTEDMYKILDVMSKYKGTNKANYINRLVKDDYDNLVKQKLIERKE